MTHIEFNDSLKGPNQFLFFFWSHIRYISDLCRISSDLDVTEMRQTSHFSAGGRAEVENRIMAENIAAGQWKEPHPHIPLYRAIIHCTSGFIVISSAHATYPSHSSMMVVIWKWYYEQPQCKRSLSEGYYRWIWGHKLKADNDLLLLVDMLLLLSLNGSNQVVGAQFGLILLSGWKESSS